MIYFRGITNIDQAKLRYRKLAKQLHPDAGGTAHEFQKMQEEYKIATKQIKEKRKFFNSKRSDHRFNPSDFLTNESPEKELLSKLENLAKVLLKKQVPQDYLRQKIKTTDSALKKGVLNELVDILDGL